MRAVWMIDAALPNPLWMESSVFELSLMLRFDNHSLATRGVPRILSKTNVCFPLELFISFEARLKAH